jgi:phosphoglycolate phosphatase
MAAPALVFDLDGTLVDTAPDLHRAVNAVLAEDGRRAISRAELRALIGQGGRTMLEGALCLTGPAPAPADLDRLYDRYLAHYGAHIADGSVAFPGVADTLAALEDGGARLGVLTNKSQGMTDLLLPALGLSRYFRAIHGSGRLAVSKPDPRVYALVLDALGGGPSVMIGDSATDVATARAAGVPVIVMSYGYTNAPAATLGADAVLDDFRAVPETARRLLG